MDALRADELELGHDLDNLPRETNDDRLRPWILRWPAPPYLLLGDVVTFCFVSFWFGFGPIQLATLATLLVSFWAFGLYRSRLALSALDDLPYFFLGVLATLGTGLGLASLLPDKPPPWEHVGRSLALFAAVVLVRGVAYTVVRRARSAGFVRHTALIMGAGRVGLRIGRTLKDHREYGLDVVGYVDPQPRVEAGADVPAPLFDRHEDLADIICDYSVRVVIVAFGNKREEDLVSILRTCDRLSCEIFMVPRLFELHNVTRDMDQIWGVPLVRVRRAPFRGVSWRLKRVMDVTVSGTALLLLLPFLLVCALAIRIESGPGVLFRQQRVGLDGREFTLLKFRTIKPDQADQSGTKWNGAQDHRMRLVGRLLRKSSIDELPQLVNILRGDMSLVGPRPERTHFVRKFNDDVPRYIARDRVPSGLTGWAQVHGLRGDTSIEDRASFDNYYIENWSLWGDVKIILRTIQQVISIARG